MVAGFGMISAAIEKQAGNTEPDAEESESQRRVHHATFP